ncbi:hypothetical protein R5W24_005120 [Gemmata sp. JC717]|uniref:hypothetical protein n=1 Tax=Gemmata algarum TaxID=2975278 RepID=UPI0021BA9ED0|nr:hypothetical protein [Gemmata algarum]MDY3555973.1 hypothetical protein [Gemmata algarum]
MATTRKPGQTQQRISTARLPPQPSRPPAYRSEPGTTWWVPPYFATTACSVVVAVGSETGAGGLRGRCFVGPAGTVWRAV